MNDFPLGETEIVWTGQLGEMRFKRESPKDTVRTISVCRHCGKPVEKALMNMDDESVIHSGSTLRYCADWTHTAELITVERKDMAVKEEPAYMMFARANVREGIPSSSNIVRELVARIDKLEDEKKDVK